MASDPDWDNVPARTRNHFSENEYLWMLNDQDRSMLKWVKAFNPFDLYSKGDSMPDVKLLTPYYRDLAAEHLPDKLKW